MRRPGEMSESSDVQLCLSARNASAVMAAIAAFLVVADVVTRTLTLVVLPGHPLFNLPRFFDLQAEGALPSFVSALYLVWVAILLGTIAAWQHSQRSTWRWHWAGLAIGFMLMSIDEAAQVHERIVGPAFTSGVMAPPGGVFTFVWLIPALALVAVLACVYLPFLRRLPRAHMWRFLAAAAVYLGSVLGLEMLEAYWVDSGGVRLRYTLLRIIGEEAGELAGIIVFSHALLVYMAESRIALSLIPVASPHDRVDPVRTR